VFLGYTDGLFEAGNASGQQFGEARLRAFLTKHRGTSGPALLQGLVNEIVAFTGHPQFDDDICALAVESTGPR
jgi:serine phosphatase RsbU (regulator of sigma subunit)